MDKLRSIYSSAYSAVITITVVVALTIGAELFLPLKDLLAKISGHHWVTKSYITLIVFFVVFFFLNFSEKPISESQTKKALTVLQVFSILGFVAILGFYLYEFFVH